MTQQVDTGFERVWRVPEAQVAAGRMPGYIAAVRIGGRVEVRAGGRAALEASSAPMGQDTLFRVASLSKPVGAALAPGTNLLGVVLARATGQPVSDLLAERITAPLGLASTGFGTPHVDRLATAYRPGPDGLELLDPPDGAYTGPPTFAKLGPGCALDPMPRA